MSIALTFNVQVDQEVIHDIIETLELYYGITLTEKIVIEILRDNHELAIEILKEFETVMRETFLDEFAERYVGHQWPIGSTSPEDTIVFYEKLIEVCKEKNIKCDIKSYQQAINDLKRQLEDTETPMHVSPLLNKVSP